MATVLKKQKSLYYSALKWFLLFAAVLVVGRLLGEINAFLSLLPFFTIPFFIERIGNYLAGALGEHLVTRQLNRLEGEYYIVNDINLPGMQIDHTLICPKGVFTIETKTYIGKVYGNGNEKYWKQYIGKNRFGIKRYSPIKQGRAHSAKLYDLLAQQELNRRIDTIVVFAGVAQVKVNPKPIPVLHRKQVYEYISQLPDIMRQEEIEKYKDGIMNLLHNNLK